jgi:CHAT domain-containing protein
MPDLKNRRIFISHALRYSEHYETLVRWFTEEPYFYRSNCSIPSDDALTDKTSKGLIMTISRISRLFVAVVSLSVFIPVPCSLASDSPLQLQQKAIKRVEAYSVFIRKTGDYKSQLPELEAADLELAESNAFFEAMKDWPAVAQGLFRRGQIRQWRNQLPEARELFGRTYDAAKQAGDAGLQSRALDHKSSVEYRLHDYGAALKLSKEAVRLAESSGDFSLLANALNGLGNAQLSALDVAASAETAERELDAARKSGDPFKECNAYYHRSNVNRQIAGQCDAKPIYAVCRQALDLALADLNQAMGIAEKQDYTYFAQLIRYEIENAESVIKLYQDKEKNLGPIEKMDIWHPRTPSDVIVSQNFLGKVLLDPKVVTDLKQEYKKLKEEAEKVGVFDQSDAGTLSAQGLMKEAEGDNKEALTFFLKAADALEKDRRTLTDEQSRSSFLGDKIDIYNHAILQLLEQRRYSEAYDILERSRSRTLADLLASREPGLVKPEEKKLFGEMMDLRTRIGGAQAKLLELSSDPAKEGNAAKIKKLHKEIKSLEAGHDLVKARMADESPRLANLMTSRTATLEALQRSMREEGYEVLTYLVQYSSVILWHITADSIYVGNVAIPRTQVSGKVSALRKSLEPGKRNNVFDETTAREMFLFFIQPALDRIKSGHLVIIPHEELDNIPFQAFLNPADGRFLGERFQLSYAPSATVLLGLKRSSPLSGGRILIAADPDNKFVINEVNSIAKLFPRGSKVAADRKPRECDVKTWVRGFDIVHLSAHGIFDDNTPMQSHLLFNKGGGDDGNLTAAEMYGLPLDGNRLVALSACETGKSGTATGNESLGMVRGLLFAGANTLLLSNWRVYADSTALWMEAFYRHAHTRTLPEAARAALLEVKENPQYGHPCHWAAFNLVGR